MGGQTSPAALCGRRQTPALRSGTRTGRQGLDHGRLFNCGHRNCPLAERIGILWCQGHGRLGQSPQSGGLCRTVQSAPSRRQRHEYPTTPLISSDAKYHGGLGAGPQQIKSVAQPPSGYASHLCRYFLCHHDRRCIGVAANQPRHQRRINHAQTIDSIAPPRRVNNSHVIQPHLAGSDRVINRVGPGANVSLQPSLRPVMRIKALTPPGIKRRRGQDTLHLLRAGLEQVQIPKVTQVLRINARRLGRVSRLQANSAPAVRAQHADMAGIAVFHMDLAHMVIHYPDYKVQL
mmetsp:Transcript_18333/g.29399  ORF Transcript_18333/g.29399 Transcript_18333/m.29399 type:complete len:290 (+) Transcript_18333:2033-2902(+)